MGERTSHPPGTLSWADVATSDVDGAKRFYGELFGWEFEDQPVGDGLVYSMARLGGLDVAAASSPQEQQPPHWTVYVTVASADAGTARAAELGATVLAGPFDVFDSGRMSVIQDPTGAILSAWEPRRHIGARLVNVPGALTWADLVTPDPDAAARFYGEWLGWTVEEIPDAQGYRVIRNGDRPNGGMLPLRPELMGPDVPPNWMPYFGTEDLGAARARAGELGGRTLVGPIDVPAGGFAVVADPQGAVFALWGGTYDD
jgi:predicted enzyme related to lactoylglutathione lyase